jgi:hypothetical protein
LSRNGILSRVRRIDHVAITSLPNLKHVVFPPFAGVLAEDFEINPSRGRRLQGRAEGDFDHLTAKFDMLFRLCETIAANRG